METDWQSWSRPALLAALRTFPESKLKLSLETRSQGNVVVIHCRGRIVYRDEASALSSLLAEVLEHERKVILDLSGVESIDSAGLGELVLAHRLARDKDANLKCAGANSVVRCLLNLTNLDSVLEMHASLEAALAVFEEHSVCANC